VLTKKKPPPPAPAPAAASEGSKAEEGPQAPPAGAEKMETE